jgi:HK97 family phage prohead protease
MLCDLRVRADGDGRTITARAVPYGVQASVSDSEGRYRESWQRGAFARTIAHRRASGRPLPVLVNHDRKSLPVGVVQDFADAADGLDVEMHLSETPSADEVLTLVRDGAVRGVSIGFKPIQSQWNRGRTEVVRTEAALHEISLVAFPTWDESLITDVRSIDDDLEDWRADTRRRVALLTLKGDLR